MAVKTEARAEKSQPSSTRYTVPFNWLASIARNMDKPSSPSISHPDPYCSRWGDALGQRAVLGFFSLSSGQVTPNTFRLYRWRVLVRRCSEDGEARATVKPADQKKIELPSRSASQPSTSSRRFWKRMPTQWTA